MVLYFVTHLWNLTLLPVFADESIYIRWAQLMMDDWHRYAFFALNDGKTPLFIWSLIPFQYLFADQLFAARFVSVLVGAAQVIAIKEFVKTLGGRAKTQWLAMLLTTILPFWFFYHRMALMDGMLTLFITIAALGMIKIVQAKKVKVITILWTGLAFGLALWSKLPALFILPIFPLMIFLKSKLTFKKRLPSLIPLGAAAFFGLVIFGLMRIAPGFGQLFHRGSDFSYPVGDVLFHGAWLETLRNYPTYFTYFALYLTPGILLLSFAGMFSNKYRRTTAILLFAALSFAFPLMFFGKVVYARYFLPSAVFITVAAVLSLQAAHDRWFTKGNHSLNTKIALGVIGALIVANTIASSGMFMAYALTNPGQLTLVDSDRSQYLKDWSSGYGIPETVQYIQQQAQTHTIAVATEGRFGTLPDGLLLYFHNRDVKNIYIEGTGEYPVHDLPDFFTQRAKDFDQVILVVNADRMQVPLPEKTLLHQYCRPVPAPCLQIWDVTQLAKQPSKPAKPTP